MSIKILPLVIAGLLCVGDGHASEPGKAKNSRQQSAQAQIDRLIERIRVLSTQLGPESEVRVIVGRDDPLAPPAGERGPASRDRRVDAADKKIRVELLGPGSYESDRIEVEPRPRAGRASAPVRAWAS